MSEQKANKFIGATMKEQIIKLIEEYERKIKEAEIKEEEACYSSKNLEGGRQYWLGIRVALNQVIIDLKDIIKGDNHAEISKSA